MDKYPNFKDINQYIDLFYFLGLCILAGLFLLWDIYFVKRIKYFNNLYRESVKEANTDSLVNSPEAALHYKVEIYKYVFMLAINVTEMIAIVMYALSVMLSSYGAHYNIFSNCTTGKISNSFFESSIANSIVTFFQSLSGAGLMFSLALGICLMKYLDDTYHNINRKPSKFIKRIFLVSCLVGFILIATGSVPQLDIFKKIYDPIIQLVYFCFWVKQSRTFYKTLRWRAVEFKVRGMSRRIVRRSVKSSHHFGIIMSLMGIGIMCIIVSQFIWGCLFIISTAVRYGPCLFHQLYGTPYFKPLLTTHKQIKILNLSTEVVKGITYVLNLVAIIVIGSQYLVATVVFFGGFLLKKLKYRFGFVRTRFTPSLTNPLLIQ